MKNQKGFAIVELTIVIMLIGIVIVAVYLVYRAREGAKTSNIGNSTGNSSTTVHSDKTELIDKNYCSDVCPQQTRSFKVYKNINSQDECDKVGGQTVKDIAWGGFIGCRPRPTGEPSVVKG